jgi:hypothetical protein
MSTVVKYNGTEISPAPFFSRSLQAIDYGQRWGHVQNITLNGLITGVAGTGRLTTLNSTFSESFKDLVVEVDGSGFYTGQNCVLESISFGSNSLVQESEHAVPYSVKLKSYELPSGVTDVSNEYSYKENTDGTVDVTHKIGAKGIKTTIDAIDNAYNFVALFTGVSPLNQQAPIFSEPADESVLISIEESVNRLDGSYEVTENWKYETGSSNNYLTTSSLGIEDSIDQEFVNLNLNVEYKGSITGDITELRNAARTIDYTTRLSQFGIDTSNCILNSFSANEDPDARSISLNANFFSGDTQGVSGVFNHSISMDWDEIKNLKTYTINSDFKVKGPADFKEKRINAKKAEIIADYDHYAAYLYHVIKDSKLYNEFGSDRDLNPLPSNFSINEGETSPNLTLSATYDDSDYIKIKTETLGNGKTYPISAGKSEWGVNVQPEKWLFSIQKAANIEGHLIVQDLQCKSRERIDVSSSITHIGNSLELGADVNKEESLDQITGFAKSIEDDIVSLSSTQSLYQTSESINSGDYTFSIDKSNIAKEPINPDLSANKFYGFNSSAYNTRDAGHQYGF